MADEVAPVVREAVKALTGVIGWISASIVGLTALCYGAGYFVIHTHLSMLGLSDVVDEPESDESVKESKNSAGRCLGNQIPVQLDEMKESISRDHC